MIEQTMKHVNSEQGQASEFKDILKGEFAAIEAYEQVIDKFPKNPEKKRIDQFKVDHKNAYHYWKNASKVINLDEKDESGIWGKVVAGFVGTAKAFGDTTTLRALVAGEEHGLSTYKEMLKSAKIPQSHKEQIRKVFIPMIEDHVNSLHAMIRLH